MLLTLYSLPAMDQYWYVQSFPLSRSYEVNGIHDTSETTPTIAPPLDLILNNTSNSICLKETIKIAIKVYVIICMPTTGTLDVASNTHCCLL